MTETFDVFRILAQTRPSGTGATTAYTKPADKPVTIHGIVVCNTTGSVVNYSVYVCKNGNTYDQTTALSYAAPIAPNESQCLEIAFTLDTASGTVGVQTSSANALNFTIIGKLREFV